MRIALVGYGKMGRLIRAIAEEKSHSIVAIVDPVSEDTLVTHRVLDEQALSDCEVAIDFSHPSVVYDHMLLYARTGIPAVIGTTGWYERLDELKASIASFKPSIIYSGNFSIGVAQFLRIVAYAAQLIAGTGLYDPFLTEIHHAAKADSPSGTAGLLADALLKAFPNKTRLIDETLRHRRPEDAIHVASVRGGWVPGTHTITFDSPVDTIELTHRARSREGFAVGALEAATWIASGKYGLFTLEDMLQDTEVQR